MVKVHNDDKIKKKKDYQQGICTIPKLDSRLDNSTD